MNEAQFQRLIQLSRKTESPLVILDADGESSVLLSLNRYEDLVNRMKPAFKSAPVPAVSPAKELPLTPAKPLPNVANVLDEPGEVETQFYLEPVE
ncbi:TPA: hypothetical protein DDZ10_01980 [Candidatus Uhrbacteria bacterium]|uniref:Antitoxin n=1 Tax=Candidatus Uhrbacteria bacterium GW2011_GWC2_53_7 TaxID=1618986 RepID=A0A0G2A856_9BACT|nr:MAG: hypothetical protein UY79_C0003G0097 [Parcubacteria group bacterium GW2011_GWA2_53_21]KKW37097.1 MAG: hypothetical protein UY82_C0001G0002 [Candidatus Uhrbacteria bacterium GW2011_GWC2_53_7]OGL72253.1 MAG: hypothetical protein A3D69_02355 [Candidatus Uhrbacteria bacterium RIFCSPHIGHO2_02_FULL_54_11]HBL39417.1 hypothetical protein [Candidatus Uhrbacteria bacterium]